MSRQHIQRWSLALIAVIMLPTLSLAAGLRSPASE